MRTQLDAWWAALPILPRKSRPGDARRDIPLGHKFWDLTDAGRFKPAKCALDPTTTPVPPSARAQLILESEIRQSAERTPWAERGHGRRQDCPIGIELFTCVLSVVVH